MSATPLPTPARIDVEGAIDSGAISSRQWTIIALCAALAMLDGFDMQAMAFAAPEIGRVWNLSSATFGPVFSASLFGGVIGGFVIGPLGDRFGPKPIVALSTATFALFTLATAWASEVSHLVVLRAIAGVGLGGAVPGIVAMISAFSPRRLRATVVTLAFCGQLLGAVLGGLLAAELMPRFGWQAVFLAGGLAPLAILPFFIWLAHDPLPHLVNSGAPARKIAAILRGLGKAAPPDAVYVVAADRAERISAKALFRDGRAAGTFFLWLTCFVGVTFYFFLANWVPTILSDSGFSLQAAVLGGVALSLGGVIGSITFGRLIDRFGPYRIMIGGYVVGSGFILLIGAGTYPMAATMSLIFAAGFFALGAQYCIPAAIVLFYPPGMHSSGVGSALGFGRLGGVVGPLIGSAILLAGGGPRELFTFAGSTALVAALCIWGMKRTENRPGAAAA